MRLEAPAAGTLQLSAIDATTAADAKRKHRASDLACARGNILRAFVLESLNGSHISWDALCHRQLFPDS
jgi:hypothetical protein